MSLVKELIKPILEAEERTVAVYGGGFKPPTKGHFEVVAQAIKKNPNIDKFIILIGGKERDGVTPEDSLLIWEIYKQYLPINVEVELSSKPPIQAVYNYAKDHPDEDVIFVIGAREGNEDDFKDIALRTKSVDNYPNLRVATIVTQGGASGTAARNAAKTDISKLKPLLPSELKDEEVEEIFNLISDKITEGRKKKKDPKKGTGKKPKGSSRRLYTDEDPKDTVGVKFSSRQDIVDTFNKKSFKAKSHARQSQVINLVHQRVRAAYNRAKDPAVKKRLKTALAYAEKRKEASKKKTQRLKKLKESKPFKREGTTFKIGQVLTFKGNKNRKTGSAFSKINPLRPLPPQRDFPVEVVDVKWNEERNEYEYSLMLLRDLSRQKKRGLKMKFQSEEDIKRRLADKQLTRAEFERQATGRKDSFDKPITYKSVGYFQEGDTYEKMAAKGKKAGSLKQGTVRKRLKIPKGKKIPLSLISKEISRMKKMDKDKDKKGVQLGDKNQKYYKALQLAKTLKTTTNVNEIAIDLTNYDGQILPGDVLRAPKGFPLGGKKLEKSLQLKVIKNSREGVNRYKLSLEDENGKKYSVRNYEMDGEYKGKKLPKWGLVRKSKKNINEVLNPATFDYKPIMASLTKSMENDGLNLKPYPTVRFIHDEEANADDFFGRTAYYNPNNKEVVLYTLGRHPKDVMRSYAHELIHVHQDNEDRLHNVQTDDVNADEYLEQLEREAYETGNIMFRSWTNKVSKDKNDINEGKKKVKDPFGLNAFAYELAMLREDETIDEPNIYLDMDGVVANFDKRFEDLSGMLPQAYVDKHGKNAFWDLIDEKHKVSFWRGIEVMPGANELVSFVSQYPYQMLTAPSVKKQSVIGKGLWVKDKVGTLYPSKPKVFYRKAKEKHMVKPELTKNDILVDDRPDTIARWAGAGGTAILYQSANQVINDLKKLGL